MLPIRPGIAIARSPLPQLKAKGEGLRGAGCIQPCHTETLPRAPTPLHLMQETAAMQSRCTHPVY